MFAVATWLIDNWMPSCWNFLKPVCSAEIGTSRLGAERCNFPWSSVITVVISLVPVLRT